MDRALWSDTSNAELEALLRLQSFFNSENFSDLTVRFNGRELKAHKIVLCIHSRWFANAFKGSYLEASLPVLELHDDDPQAIEGMLRHFYDLDPMSHCESSRLSTSTQTEPFAKLMYLVQLYAAADKYDVPILRKNVLSRFMPLASQNWLILWYSGELPQIIETIYTSTAQKNDCLRLATVEISSTCINDLREIDLDALQDLIGANTDFSVDILMRVPIPRPIFTLPHTLIGRSDLLELHVAAKQGDLGQSKHLIRTGTYVNARDINDSTPLHFAAFHGHLSVVKFLVESARADVNACCETPAYSTPLAWAQYAGHYEIVDYLAAAGGAARETENLGHRN